MVYDIAASYRHGANAVLNFPKDSLGAELEKLSKCRDIIVRFDDDGDEQLRSEGNDFTSGDKNDFNISSKYGDSETEKFVNESNEGGYDEEENGEKSFDEQVFDDPAIVSALPDVRTVCRLISWLVSEEAQKEPKKEVASAVTAPPLSTKKYVPIERGRDTKQLAKSEWKALAERQHFETLKELGVIFHALINTDMVRWSA